MKKHLKDVVILVIITAILAGCQPTPDEAVIVNKGDGSLENMIASSAQSQSPDAQPASLPEVVGAPETYKDAYKNEKGDVTVTIDADVEVPDIEALPAVQVSIAEFTQEQADRFGGYFLKGASLFSEEQVRTKAEIEESILNEKQYLQDMKKNFTGIRDEDIAESEKFLEELKKQYAQAPEERKITPATLELKSDGNGTNIFVFADLGKDDRAVFSLWNSDTYCGFEFNNDGQGRYEPFFPPVKDGTPRGMSTSRKDAEEIVIQCLSDIGISGMQIENVNLATYYREDNDYNDEEYKKTAKQCYVFSLTRVVGGIPVSHIEPSTPLGTDDPSVPVPQEPDYNLMRDPEKLEVSVDDTGIVYFQWTNPTQEISMLSEHVTLMPFEDIVQRAKDNMFFKNYTAYGSTAEINITSIRLGMMRTVRKDKPGEYLIIPVWDFIGNNTSGFKGHEDWLPFGDQSYVTINAIDGSFINRDWGY